jgi:tRNA pseudouridine13 synthase
MNSPISSIPAHGTPVISAQVKAQPEHFIVREWLGFAPDNEGDHMLVTVRKRGANTLWVAKQLPSRMIAPELWLQVSGDGFQVIGATRHKRKLKRGAHKGNEFEITLTNVVGDQNELIKRLEVIKNLGVPNYFGAQRFGHDGNNLRMAMDWFAGGQVIHDRHQRGFALSAARSLLFNAILQARIEQRTWNTVLSGDIANLNGSNSVFAVDEVDAVLKQRCAEFDIHPTGALWGEGELLTRGAVKEFEQQIARNHEVITQGLCSVGLEQERRALRVHARNFTWELAGDQLILRFGLSKGAFATVVIAELIGSTAGSLAESEDG